MKILSYDDLPQGGFAGLKERQFVKDSRVFGPQHGEAAWNGLGNFIYLADANFNPKGRTGMHAHKEVDVISVMVEGSISHAGSLEHGQGLEAGQIQVQRAGGEGFRHDEINPHSRKNQMIQLWVAPDQRGEPAGYKVYSPKAGEVTRIYGGPKDSTKTFYSRTSISVVNAKEGDSVNHQGEVMAYLSKGSGMMNGQYLEARTLIRDATGLKFNADEEAQLILIYLTL